MEYISVRLYQVLSLYGKGILIVWHYLAAHRIGRDNMHCCMFNLTVYIAVC
jgi:hypothetical protein